MLRILMLTTLMLCATQAKADLDLLCFDPKDRDNADRHHRIIIGGDGTFSVFERDRETLRYGTTAVAKGEAEVANEEVILTFEEAGATVSAVIDRFTGQLITNDAGRQRVESECEPLVLRF